MSDRSDYTDTENLYDSDMLLNEEEINGSDEFSIENIIAEYRSKGYIETDRVPSHIVTMETQSIIDSVLNSDNRSRDNETPQNAIPKPEKNADDLPEETVTDNLEESSDPDDDTAVTDEETMDYSALPSEIPEKKSKKSLSSFFAKLKKVAAETDDEDDEAAPIVTEDTVLSSELVVDDSETETIGTPDTENIESDSDRDESDRDSGIFANSRIFSRIRKSRDSRNDDGLAPGDAFYDDFEVDEDDRYGEHFSLADKVASFINKRREISAEKRRYSDEVDDETSYTAENEYIPEDEPSYKDEANRFSKDILSLYMRELISFALAFAAVIFSVIYEKGSALPHNMSASPLILCGVLMIIQLVNMALGIDSLIDGFNDIVKFDVSAESVLLLSNVFTLIDGFVILLTKDISVGIPMSAVSASAMFFAIFGRRIYRMSMAEAFRMAASSKKTTAILSDTDSIDGKTVLKKGRRDVSGFHRLSMLPDFSETLYSSFGPIIIALSVLLAVVTVFTNDTVVMFTHSLAALFSVSASFASLIAFALPFRVFTKRIHASGGAVAGWAGVCEVAEADGTLITDNDFFPAGTVKVTGVQVLEGFSTNRVIGYAGSLVSVSQSALSAAFESFMHSKGVSRHIIEGFTFYEGGGLEGRIYDDTVLVGPAAFMNLMGIRIPGNYGEKNCLFAAVNHQLSAVFTLSYSPANSVRKAIGLLIRSKAKVMFAAKDANLTPVMLNQRFKLDIRSFEYIPVEDCYRISSQPNDMISDSVGFVCKQGLLPYSTITTYAKRIKDITIIGAMLSVISALVGLAFVFLLCMSGTFTMTTPINILLYQLLSQGIIFLLTFVFVRI